MEPAGANLGRFPSKFLLMIIPGLVASGIVALVLYAVHVSPAPSSSELLTDVTPQGDGLSAEERRGLTRQMLKDRRENPQESAEVRPTPTPRSATTELTEDPVVDAKAPPVAPAVDAKAPAVAPAVDAKAPPVAPAVDAKAPPVAPAVDAKTLPDRPPAAAPLPAARPTIARARPDSTTVAAPVVTSGAVAPPASASAQSAPMPTGTTAPTTLRPVTVNPPSDNEPEPRPRGFAANVFSSLSTIAGTAANATGNTVNWVIDLPGKAISAGGRLFGADSAASDPQPAASPPPATAPPPPKRNL